MLVEFIYRLPTNIVSLTQKEMVDFIDDRINGWIDQGDASRLHHCSMFMVCEYEKIGETTVLRNPTGIVAMNESQALDTYFKATGNNNGMIFCSIISDCSSITVEPTGQAKE